MKRVGGARNQVGEGEGRECEKQCALMEQRDDGGERKCLIFHCRRREKSYEANNTSGLPLPASLKSKRVDMYPDPSTLRRLLQGKWAKVSVGLQTSIGR